MLGHLEFCSNTSCFTELNSSLSNTFHFSKALILKKSTLLSKLKLTFTHCFLFYIYILSNIELPKFFSPRQSLKTVLTLLSSTCSKYFLKFTRSSNSPPRGTNFLICSRLSAFLTHEISNRYCSMQSRTQSYHFFHPIIVGPSMLIKFKITLFFGGGDTISCNFQAIKLTKVKLHNFCLVESKQGFCTQTRALHLFLLIFTCQV